WQIVVWYMTGTQGTTMNTWKWVAQSAYAGWRIVASGDFNGDGRLDIVLQHDATRQVSVWTMGGSDGSVPSGWFWLSSAGVAGWKVIGTADLNADHHLDLVWQNDTTRQVVVWYLNGVPDTLMRWDWIAAAGVQG